MDSKIKVKILNREYVLKGELDSDYIGFLAEKLNARLDEMKSYSPRKMDDLHLVILVALNLLDEAEMSQKNPDEISEDEAVKKTNRMITMLEKGIIGDIY
jgi:cell division protein ZapA (FtsZ GTPase activity inhibitor)